MTADGQAPFHLPSKENKVGVWRSIYLPTLYLKNSEGELWSAFTAET